MMVYRQLTEADIPRGLALCRQAGWNQLERDWKIFLTLSPDGCLAVEKDMVIGTAATLKYGDRFSWIGMVLVDKEYRGRGIGMELLLKALDLLKKETTVKLDATPAGRQLYLKLGFVEEYPLSRMIKPGIRHTPYASAARVFQKGELETIAELDFKVFGANRLSLLEWMYAGAPTMTYVFKKNNKILGYCLGRHGNKYIHIGPVVAADAKVARQLVSAALNQHIGQAVMLDISHFDPSWMAWLVSIGFEEQRPFYRMYRGLNDYPGEPEKQYAILGPEFG